MKKELQSKLFEKYPKIFRQKDLPKQQTAMCWGIDCDNGWFDLIDSLCFCIQSRVVSQNEKMQKEYDSRPKSLVPYSAKFLICEATQVKEKFGGLRFYYGGGDDVIYGMVSLAESMSFKICECCGSPGKSEGKRWIRTLCEKCRSI